GGQAQRHRFGVVLDLRRVGVLRRGQFGSGGDDVVQAQVGGVGDLSTDVPARCPVVQGHVENPLVVLGAHLLGEDLIGVLYLDQSVGEQFLRRQRGIPDADVV